MSNPKIIVTRKWPSEVEQELETLSRDLTLNKADEPFSKAQLRNAIADAECVLPTVTDRIDAEVIGNNPRCKFLGNFGVGFEHIDLQAAKRANIVVTNTPEVLTDCTADLTMTLILTVARRAAEGERELRGGGWTGWRPTHMLGSKVSGKTLGLIGFGRIGRAVARRARHGFGMRIAIQRPNRPEQKIMDELDATYYLELNEMLPICDFVSIHCPSKKETYHLINTAQLKLMKPAAYLINTARGNIVNTNALITALEQGAIQGAGLDVYENEPNFDQRLLNLQNAVLLPHLGSASRETRIAMGMKVVQNLKTWLNGDDPPNKVG